MESLLGLGMSGPRKCGPEDKKISIGTGRGDYDINRKNRSTFAYYLSDGYTTKKVEERFDVPVSVI